MNKKAQNTVGIGLVIITAIFLFMVGIMNVNFLKDEISRTRNVQNLNCADGSISDGTKLTCLAVDIVLPYFIITVFSAAGGLIMAKFVI